MHMRTTMTEIEVRAGKLVVEDAGVGYGRTRDWPAIPSGLCQVLPTYDSTTVVCAVCGSPYGGLRLVPGTGMFVHRSEQDCHI